MARLPRRAHVLIAGGGIAGVEALMALRDLGEHELDVELIAPRDDFVLRPQIIGVPWGGSPLRAGLLALTAQMGSGFQRATITGVNVDDHLVHTSDGGVIAYDVLLVTTGAVVSIGYPNIDTIGFGGLPMSVGKRHGEQLAIVVPPGSSWTLPAYQLALLAAPGGPVTVITPETTPAEVFGSAAEHVAAMLDRRDVQVRTSCVVPVGTTDVHDLADRVIALPLLRGPALEGLPATTGGFIPVDDEQCVIPASGVYAAGDVTNFPIKQGGLAAHQAEVAATAIVDSLGGDVPPVPEPAVLRGKLVDGDDVLYLRRRLDGVGGGEASPEPLWKPEAAMCAWRLTSWMQRHVDELHADPLGPMARPPAER